MRKKFAAVLPQLMINYRLIITGYSPHFLSLILLILINLIGTDDNMAFAYGDSFRYWRMITPFSFPLVIL